MQPLWKQYLITRLDWHFFLHNQHLTTCALQFRFVKLLISNAVKALAITKQHLHRCQSRVFFWSGILYCSLYYYLIMQNQIIKYHTSLYESHMQINTGPYMKARETNLTSVGLYSRNYNSLLCKQALPQLLKLCQQQLPQHFSADLWVDYKK